MFIDGGWGTIFPWSLVRQYVATTYGNNEMHEFTTTYPIYSILFTGLQHNELKREKHVSLQLLSTSCGLNVAGSGLLF